MSYSAEVLEGIDLPTHRGGVVTLGARPARPQLICFVPNAFTPVCAVELDGLVDLAPDAEREGVDLIIVSCDADAVLAAWLDLHLPETAPDLVTGPPPNLLAASDFWPHGRAARAFGAFDEVRGVAERLSFGVHRDGAVRLVAESLPGESRPHRAHLRALDWLAEPR